MTFGTASSVMPAAGLRSCAQLLARQAGVGREQHQRLAFRGIAARRGSVGESRRCGIRDAFDHFQGDHFAGDFRKAFDTSPDVHKIVVVDCDDVAGVIPAVLQDVDELTTPEHRRACTRA